MIRICLEVSMTRFLFSLFAALALVSGQSTSQGAKPQVAASKPDPKTAPVKKSADGRPTGIPTSAVKIGEGAWRNVENGQAVIYRTSAFGFAKLTEEEYAKVQSSQLPVAASRPDPKAAPVKRHPDGRPAGVPYDAVKISDGAWRIVENGTPVVYRSTAFGYSKVTEEENVKIQRMIAGSP